MTPPRASSRSRRCCTCSTATSATPTWPTTGCAHGRTSGTTTPAAPATARGCRLPATTRTSSATARSASAPTRPTSTCRHSRARTTDTAGLWYAFTVGSVRFISLNNDDVCYQDGGNSYVRGYSHGAQKAWLEQELRATRADRDIDWIVVCMHQVVDQHRRSVQRRRPRNPAGVGAAVRRVRRGSGRVRARAPLRAFAPDPRSAGRTRRSRRFPLPPTPRSSTPRRGRCTW